MKKQKNKRLTWRDLWAPLAGFITIYAITMLLILVRVVFQGYLDIAHGNAFSTMIRLTDTKDLEMTLLKNAIGFYGDFGMVAGVVLVILIAAFVFMGWLILKIATHKVWYLPALPVVFMALFSFTRVNGSYSSFAMPFTQLLDDPLKPYFIFACLLAALLGGWIQRHVSVHK